MSKRGASGIWWLVLCGLVLGCGGRDAVPPDFVWLLGAEPETIDPGLATGQPDGRIARNIFEGLTYHQGEDLRIMPGVASSWDMSPDGRTYTFHLRSEARWSDGRPVTAQDFAYAWTRVLDPRTASRYANMLFGVEGAEAFNRGEVKEPARLGLQATDDTTFVVRLTSPCAYFLDLCAFYTLLPVPRWTIEAHGEEWIKPQNIVSNGPFLLEKWQLNRRIRMRKNPRYWNADAVTLRVADAISSENINANFNLYMSGILDWGDSGAVPLVVIPQLLARPDFHVGPYFNTYFYRFNVTRAPFNDARVRRAFCLATDREAITRYVLRAGQQPARSLVPPGIPGYTIAEQPAYDVEGARRLLAEAGYPAGRGFPKVELLFNTSEAHKQIAEVLQQQWKEALGVDVLLVNQEWKVFLSTTDALDYWISRGSWIGDYLDPNTFLDLWTSTNGNNRTGFTDPEYDALIQRTAETLDPEARLALLHEAEDWVLNREAIVLPLYYYVTMNMYDERDFAGLKPNLLNLVDLRSVKPLRGHRGRPRDAGLGRDEPTAQTRSRTGE